MSILPKSLFLVLKILAVLSDQENRLALLVAGQFFLNYQGAIELVEEKRRRWCLYGAA